VSDLENRTDGGAPRAEDADMAALRALRDHAPVPGAAALTAGRRRLTAAAVQEQESRSLAAGGGRKRWSRPQAHPVRRVRPVARRALLAGATAAAVAAGVLFALPGGGAGTRDQASHGPDTVATVLAAAALTAENNPAVRPRPEQWVLHDEVGCMNRKCTYGPTWVRGDGALWATVREPVGRTPKIDLNKPFVDASGRASLRFQPIAAYDALSRLPTEPRALLQRVSADPRFRVAPDYTWRMVRVRTVAKNGSTRTVTSPVTPAPAPPAKLTPSQQFVTIVELLHEMPVIPARIDAALYRALALIPGLRLLGEPMNDGYGRPSTTLVMDYDYTMTLSSGKKIVNHFTQYLFLDPRTYAYQGSLSVSHSQDTDSPWEYARKAVGVTDKAGTLPGGALWRPYPLAAPGPVPGR
jgi:hypothetical protein